MQQAVDMAPSADSLFRLAIMQKNDHEIGLALASLQRARQQAGSGDELLIDLVTAGYLIHAGKREEGLARFETLKPQLEPSDAFVTKIAWFYAVADRKSEFYDAFARSLEINRDQTLLWIDQEVDIDRYRNEPRFKQLVTDARTRQ